MEMILDFLKGEANLAIYMFFAMFFLCTMSLKWISTSVWSLVIKREKLNYIEIIRANLSLALFQCVIILTLSGIGWFLGLLPQGQVLGMWIAVWMIVNADATQQEKEIKGTDKGPTTVILVNKSRYIEKIILPIASGVHMTGTLNL